MRLLGVVEAVHAHCKLRDRDLATFDEHLSSKRRTCLGWYGHPRLGLLDQSPCPERPMHMEAWTEHDCDCHLWSCLCCFHVCLCPVEPTVRMPSPCHPYLQVRLGCPLPASFGIPGLCWETQDSEEVQQLSELAKRGPSLWLRVISPFVEDWACQPWTFLPILRTHSPRTVYPLLSAKSSSSTPLSSLFIFEDWKGKRLVLVCMGASFSSFRVPLCLGSHS